MPFNLSEQPYVSMLLGQEAKYRLKQIVIVDPLHCLSGCSGLDVLAESVQEWFDLTSRQSKEIYDLFCKGECLDDHNSLAIGQILSNSCV